MKDSEQVLVIPLVEARFCAGCEVIFYRDHKGWVCPACNGENTIHVQRWIKPLSSSEEKKDRVER